MTHIVVLVKDVLRKMKELKLASCDDQLNKTFSESCLKAVLKSCTLKLQDNEN